MDEVRIWSGARTPQQIQDGMSGEITAAPGLLGRWGFNEGAGGAGRLSPTAAATGTTASLGGTFTWVPGAPFDDRPNHAPDAPVLNAPGRRRDGVASPATLDVSVSDSDGDPLTVTYFGRPQGPWPRRTSRSWRFPTRSTTSTTRARAATFTAQTNWIVDNRAPLNIAFASHLGDIVENQDQFIVEWQRADTSMSVLEANGVPYGMSPGNHDQYPERRRELLRPVLPAVAVPRAAVVRRLPRRGGRRDPTG